MTLVSGCTAGGTTTVFYYAGSQVLLEKQGDTFTAAYTHGNALLRRNSEYPLYDGHGSERTVTNGSETVTGTINFEVHTDPYRTFGQTAGTTGSSSSPYMPSGPSGYAGAWGYRTDGDAGLMHVGAHGVRSKQLTYPAQVGRFITRDTVLSEHPYLYCEHDAVNWVDPSGHFVIKIWWFHCWIEYPGGSIGYWPGSPNPVWGPGLIQSPDPYGGTFGVPVFYFPSPVADNALTVFGRLDGDRVGVYQFPMFQCIHGAFVLAAMAVIVDHADRRKHHKGFEPSWDFPLGP